MQISNEIKLELIKKAISTESGWEALVSSIKSYKEPAVAKYGVIKYFLTISKERLNQNGSEDAINYFIYLFDKLEKSLEEGK